MLAAFLRWTERYSASSAGECANRGFLYLGNKCLAVHTDSLETQRESTEELNDPYLPGKRGCVGRPCMIKETFPWNLLDPDLHTSGPAKVLSWLKR